MMMAVAKNGDGSATKMILLIARYFFDIVPLDRQEISLVLGMLRYVKYLPRFPRSGNSRISNRKKSGRTTQQTAKQLTHLISITPLHRLPKNARTDPIIGWQEEAIRRRRSPLQDNNMDFDSSMCLLLKFLRRGGIGGHGCRIIYEWFTE